MKKNIKIAAALTICGVVLVGAIYYTNSIYIPSVKKDQAEKADSSAQADQSGDYNYTISSVQAEQNAAGSSSSGSSVQVTKDSNGDVTISRSWDAKKGDLDTSTSSPDSKTSANVGSGGAKITGSDGTYKGETSAKASNSTTKSTTPTTPKTNGSSDTGTKPSGGTKTGSTTPKNGDTRTVDGQEQKYVDGFGWVNYNSQAEATNGDWAGPDVIGNANDQLGEQVGEMG